MKSLTLAALGVMIAIGLGVAPARAFQVKEPQPLDSSQPVPYYIDDGTGRTGFRSSDRELAAWAVAAWQRHVGAALELVPGPESTALVRVYWADQREGQYGEMRPLIVRGRNGAAVYVRPDM